MINKSKEADTTTGDAIIDIMGSDNDKEEISVINEKSKDGKSLWIRSTRYLVLFFLICVLLSYNLSTSIIQQIQE